jgi:mono/diheme cytochrome c family protein
MNAAEWISALAAAASRKGGAMANTRLIQVKAADDMLVFLSAMRERDGCAGTMASEAAGRRQRPARLWRLRSLLSAAVLLIAPAATALAAGQVEEGQRIAERLCAGCHTISGQAPSPLAAAPPFALIGRKYPVSHLAEALAEGIVTGHGPVRMPEFVFEPDEIDDLLAYLESVQE